MRIPDRLASLLAKDQATNAAVLTAISRFEPWLKQNRLEFFPEYTDHGIEHFEGVLVAASSLISDGAWDVLRPSDAAALVISIVLHDAGMHISADGFKHLIGTSDPWQTVNASYDRPWNVLWEEFVGEASRFDGRTLTKLFGTASPIHRPHDDSCEWKDRDRLLIGEFLRRHHARLAHDIAVFGVPGVDDDKRVNLGAMEPEDLDLFGLIARSHGMPLRKAVDWHEQKATKAFRDYRGVFVPYVMAILRIADYLQVGAERAPSQILQIRKLRSPISVREWKINQAIESITNASEDPEAIFVTARPRDVTAFLRLQDLFRDLQRELDESWAVLGEAYGLHTQRRLNHLGIVLRRIRSTLDDLATFEHTIDYVPQRASFSAADGELLKLLVKPLYGDDWTIGIRELMQNAIDAVRERSASEGRTSDGDTKDAPQVQLEVVKDKDATWFVCRDQGIGMTFEVISGYFLRASPPLEGATLGVRNMNHMTGTQLSCGLGASELAHWRHFY
ncbi:MAG: hypothetical protein QM775_02415 [Pirellulales bacterium]